MSDSVYDQIAELLNTDPNQAHTLDIDQLRSVLKYAEEAYYGGKFESPFEDKVYDLINDIYQQRRPKPKVKLLPGPRPIPRIGAKPKPKPKPKSGAGGAAESESASLEHVPPPAPDSRLGRAPFWMGSMTKINHGDGQLFIWKAKYDTPFIVSAKMDGSSAMLFMENGRLKLLTRGKTITDSQDISNLIPHLDLPKFPDEAKAIRGELIINLSSFNSTLKKSSTETGTGSKKYKNARNAVPGITRHFATNDKIEPFYTRAAKLINFVAYEVIVEPNIKSSDQFKLLQSSGFKVPPLKMISTNSKLNDEVLSKYYDDLMDSMDYDIDGLIVCSDHPYPRNTSGNPEYARAYKKPLHSQYSSSSVIDIEWNVSRHKFIKPVIIIDPIELTGEGVTISRITGNNAKFVIDNHIGKGAVVKFIRSGGVIPKIVDVIKKAPKSSIILPDRPHKWNSTKVDFIVDDTDADDEHSVRSQRDSDVKRLRFFTQTINAKGIGESIIAKIYDMGFTTIPELVTLNPSDISSLGKKTPENVINALHKALSQSDIPTLMAATATFERGVGLKRIQSVFKKYPDFLEMARDQPERYIIHLIT